MSCLIAVGSAVSTLLFPVPVEARSIDRILVETGATYGELDREYLQVINTFRRANGLPDLYLRAQPSHWRTYNSCLSDLNVWRHNNGVAMGHLGSGQVGRCGSFPELALTGEVWGGWGGTATDAVAARLSTVWYASDAHRSIILSNADWVQVHMVSYRTANGSVWHLGQLQFGVDDPGRDRWFTAASPDTGRHNPAATPSESDPHHPLHVGRFHGMGWRGELLAPRGTPGSAYRGWADPAAVSLEPALDGAKPHRYYRYGTARLYVAYFGRSPDRAGWAYWNRRRALDGVGLGDISEAFAGSDEFRTRYGSVDNSQFVSMVYRNVLGRSRDRAGHRYWLGLLDRGAISRGEMMVHFSDSAEFTRVAGPRLTGRHWNGDMADSYRRALPTTVGLGL